MLLLASTSDIIRVITPVALNTLEVHASYVDLNGTTVTLVVLTLALLQQQQLL